MLFVLKYGGSSLADREKLLSAARRSADLAARGNRVVVVVSAQGDTTDEMIRRARDVNPRGSLREMDAYLAAGEQMSAGLMAMALGALGCSAVSLTGAQAGILTEDNHGNARIARIDPDRIRRELDGGRVVVVAGFQGVNDRGDITTLGRGGSDTTAVALAASLEADRCLIYTDVDGVYDRDPRIYPDARRFDRIGYEKMLSLVENGAQVLHGRSVETARANGIRVEVLSAFREGGGTTVGQE